MDCIHGYLLSQPVAPIQGKWYLNQPKSWYDNRIQSVCADDPSTYKEIPRAYLDRFEDTIAPPHCDDANDGLDGGNQSRAAEVVADAAGHLNSVDHRRGSGSPGFLSIRVKKKA